jgi:penicillin-binding protein 2
MSKYLRLRNKKAKEIEPHEIFLDNLAQKKEEEFGLSKKRLEVSLPITTLRSFSLFVFLLFFILLGKSFQTQFVEGEHFSNLAQRNILSISTVQTSRGIIYDRNYNQLVYNLPQHNLHFNKKKLTTNSESAFNTVAQIIDKSAEEIFLEIKSSPASIITVKKDLTHNELVQLEARMKELNGFNIASITGREYENGETFSHIIGYIGKIDREMLRENPGKYTIHDYVGKMGVEKHYEEFLTRVGEKIKRERDAFGNIKSEEVIEPAQSGENIVLTIDKDLQEIVERKTKEKLEEIGSRKAAVIVIEPSTGEVLAMISLPSYDNNLFQKNTSQEVFVNLFENEDGVFINRIITSGYPTGSVIKPLLAAAALEEGIISPEKKIHSPGYISIPNPWNPSEPTIFRDFQAHGWRDMREAIAVSSNVYFYAIGGGYEDQRGLGVERIRQYLLLFGWGEKTGIDLPGERSGFIPFPEWKKNSLNDFWRIGDTYNLSIGQGYLSTTPIQVAVSFASLVNGGKILVPYVVKEIIDDNGEVLQKRNPEVIRENFISPKNLNVVKEGMRQTTLIGTARSLQTLPVTSGAKTGTAQTSKPGIDHNWVSAFAPYDNPEVLITVIIEEVKGVTPVATHLARDILTEYFLSQKKEIEI